MRLFYRKNILIIWLTLSTFSCLTAFDHYYHFNRGCNISSMNDEWEHQTMAVNYAKGYGLYKLGAYSKIEDYHFATYDSTFPFLRKLIVEYPTEYYHRAAGFSFIIGNLYKITGTDPAYLRVFNFILMVLSWLIICYTVFLFQYNKKLLYFALYCLPVFMVANFFYINLIGDDTLVIFSLSVVFFILIKWLLQPKLTNSLLLILVLVISILIKSTLFFLPIFMLLFSLLIRKKEYILHSTGISIILFSVLFFISGKINERHQVYKYVDQQKFHTDMMSANWTKTDSDFIRQHNLKFVDNVRFGFLLYKGIASYLFERQFYTKTKFLLSGQSLYLMIDGNNEGCALSFEKHIGSWRPMWSFNRQSFFYHYDTKSSPYIEILKFYLHKPVYLPLIMYTKLYAGYYWNYLFIILSGLQLFLCLVIYKKVTSKKTYWLLFFVSAGIHLFLHTYLLTPIIIVIFCISFIYLMRQQKIITPEEKLLFYLPYFFIFYFIFLTLLMFGLNRYTCIANGMVLLAAINLITQLRSFYQNNSIPKPL